MSIGTHRHGPAQEESGRMDELTENMIRWAESKLGSTEYAGWCLSFIEDALEISNNNETE